MATQEIFHRARLIPVSGIGSTQEAEERATSALLAVLSVVRDFSKALLSPLGASRAEKATVDTYSEVVMNLDRRRRSEEHTSELQSRENLVCRLLLEKKNINIQKINII